MLIYINVQFDNEEEFISVSLNSFQQASEVLDTLGFLLGHKEKPKKVNMDLIKDCERKCNDASVHY